jgi:hypothetical protein
MLIQVKGMSENKIDKILEAGKSLIYENYRNLTNILFQ